MSLESWGSSFGGRTGGDWSGRLCLRKVAFLFSRWKRCFCVDWWLFCGKKFCSSCLNPFDSGLVVCVFFVGVSCLEGVCAV